MRGLFRSVLRRTFSSVAPYYEEIKVPVPWGHLSAKWWGPQDKQPVLAIHGWQENCNSFDPLMKMLPPDLGVLAFDMPGNGFSAPYPTYGTFHVMEDVAALRALIKHLKFEQPLRFLLHSYSIGAGFTYAASFPKDVEKLLAIDFIKPMAMHPKVLAEHGAQLLDRLIKFQTGDSAKEATLEEHAAQYRKGVMNSMSLENAKLLMERATALNPATGLYKITRDPRIKINFYYSFPNEFMVEMAKILRCKILYIKATKGLVFEPPRAIKEVQVEIEKAANVEYAEVEGTHHVHMEKPELIAPYVLDYLFDRKN